MPSVLYTGRKKVKIMGDKSILKTTCSMGTDPSIFPLTEIADKYENVRTGQPLGQLVPLTIYQQKQNFFIISSHGTPTLHCSFTIDVSPFRGKPNPTMVSCVLQL